MSTNSFSFPHLSFFLALLHRGTGVLIITVTPEQVDPNQDERFTEELEDVRNWSRSRWICSTADELRCLSVPYQILTLIVLVVRVRSLVEVTLPESILLLTTRSTI